MTIETPHSTEQFLLGGGELGDCIRATDWSLTPLGPPTGWPQSLRTTLSILLSSRFPMFLWWGPDLIQFYNDAYRPSLGNTGKHPHAVGQRGMECWPEIWPTIGPLIEKVIQQGESVYFEDQLIPIYRNGGLEDVYWTFSYSPVRGESGSVEGVLVVCNETTEKVQNLKRLEETGKQLKSMIAEAQDKERRFRNVVMQAPIGITIFRGPDFRVEMANETYLQVVGRQEEQFVGCLLREALPEVMDAVGPLLENVYKTGTPYYGVEFEVPIERYGTREICYFNFVYYPLREEDETISGVMVVATEMTQQVQARKKLEESETRFRNMVTQSPIPMTIFRGEDFIIELANETMIRNLWRRTWDDVKGRPLLEVFPELRDQPYPALLKSVMETGIAYSDKEAEAVVDGPGGKQTHYLDFEYAPLFNLDRTVSGIMVTVNDVTEKVKARQQIIDDAERLTLATEGTRLATWDLDLQTSEIIHSPRMARIFGLPEDTHLTLPEMRKAVHPRDLSVVEKAFEAALKSGNYYYEARVIHPDQAVRWIQTRGKVLYNNDHVPLRMLGTMIDITDRKRAERIIEESEKKFRTLADSMPQFIWTADRAGNLNYFSRSVYQYTGITEPKKLAESWWKTIHPEDRKATLKAWQESLIKGTDFLFEHRFRHHEGTYRWQLSRAVPQRDVAGKIEMWVGTSTDIHDRKLFTDELENKVLQRTTELHLLNQNLLKSNDELAQFAYVASHDLQEPLRKIQTFAGRILDVESRNLSERGRDYFQRMQSASVRMQQLIVDLLSFSRANTNEKYFEVTDLNHVLQLVKEQLKDTIDQKQAVILSSTLPVLNIISFQFEQLFTNLIANALKFSKTDVPPLIAIHADKVGRDHVHHKDAEDILYHRIVITDNGIGFEPQFNERIFQVFQRLHGKDEYPGTGIGLAICKKIIENHQGFIEAAGQLNKGAVFTVFVPARN
ncbi:MAG TPA: PAS domain-containing protein [Chryseolinea sp.]